MHARSLLDYLSDAERAQRGGRSDVRDWASILERLQELELRLGDLRNASEQRDAPAYSPGSDRQALRDEISSILRRRGVEPQARRAPSPPPLAPRDWVEPPPLAPSTSFQTPAERADPNLVKFIEAVRLLGRAADKFMVDGDAVAPQEDDFGPARSPERAVYSPGAQRISAPRQDRLAVDPPGASAGPRVTDSELVRLWEEVEQLRRTLSQLSFRRDSY